MSKFKLNKGILITVIVLLATLFSCYQAFAINPQPEPPGDIQIFIDGQLLSLDTSPLLVEDRTLVPMRAIFEALGATVTWIPDTQSVQATRGNTTITLQIANKAAYINNIEKTLDVPAMLYNDRTLVPLRFVGEALEATVDWVDETRQVIITTKSTTKLTANLSELKIRLKELTSKEYDAAFIKGDILNKKAIDTGLLDSISTTFVPAQKDFSKYTTLTGNQDGWGGCIGRSMVHVMNMQNEMECSYTPDLSLWYIVCKQEQLANGGAVNTKYVLENYGVCAEANLPTNYDQATNTDFSTMPHPTAANDAEAAYYKVALLSESMTPDADNMKKLMLEYGPILIEGIFPNNYPTGEGHCMTVVGWDDSHDGSGAFKILNSWGDHWNGDGFMWLKYSDLANSNLSFRYIQDGLSDRTNTKYAYSARINLQGGENALRKQLTVKIGAEGKAPWTFWAEPNKVNCVDNSQDLCIDIPLPDYAASNWPPSNEKKWYIEVTNSNNGSYTLKEFTLARQVKNAQGKLSAETFSFPKEAVVNGGSTKKFYIPTYIIPELPRVIKPVLPTQKVIQSPEIIQQVKPTIPVLEINK